MKTINLGIEDTSKNVLIAKSPMDQERQYFMSFLDETKINFSWLYANMLGLDPDLVVHNLLVRSDVKPFK